MFRTMNQWVLAGLTPLFSTAFFGTVIYGETGENSNKIENNLKKKDQESQKRVLGSKTARMAHPRHLVHTFWSRSVNNVCIAAAIGLLSPLPGHATSSPLRDWTIPDSIGVTYFSDINASYYSSLMPGGSALSDPLPAALTAFSPNKQYFFVITHRGVLARDSNVYELAVFDVSAVRAAFAGGGSPQVKPVVTKSFESFSLDPALQSAKWEADSGAIILQGTAGGPKSTNSRVRQVLRLELPSGSAKRLTSGAEEPKGVDYRDRGVMYFTYGGGTLADLSLEYPMWRMPLTENGDMKMYAISHRDPQKFYCSYDGGPAHKIKGRFAEWWVSPGGRKAVALQQDENDQHYFVVIDIQTGKTSLLLSAGSKAVGQAFGRPPRRVFWRADSRHVILVGVRVPAVGEAAGSKSSEAIADYDLSTRQWQVIQDLDLGEHKSGRVRSVSASEAGDQLIVSYDEMGTMARRIQYIVRDDKWSQRSEGEQTEALRTRASSSVTDIAVFVRQGISDPPVLIASNGQKELVLLDPNPDLKNIWQARQRSLDLGRSSNGGRIVGQLFLPRNLEQPLPLVIQIVAHADPRIFAPDGPVPAGYGAQALVGRGFAVLSVQRVQSGTLSEGRDMVELLDRAIDVLAADGLVDRTRVGAVGHSRQGYQILYSVTHPGRNPLAAAAVLDSFSSTYAKMLELGAYGDERDEDLEVFSYEYKSRYGGLFWQQREKWLEEEPTFNVDRVRTPLLATYHNRAPTPDTQEPLPSPADDLIGAFRLNRKPLEVMWFPQSGHVLVRPNERLMEMRSVADWMSFWLQGRTPQDVDSAARWAILKEKQRKALKMSP